MILVVDPNSDADLFLTHTIILCLTFFFLAATQNVVFNIVSINFILHTDNSHFILSLAFPHTRALN